MNRGRWDPKLHPRGNPANRGQFRSAGTPAWVKRISDSIGQVDDPADHRLPRGGRAFPSLASPHGGHFPVYGNQFAVEHQPATSTPIEQIGHPRGDGTYEALASDLVPYADQLAGRVQWKHGGSAAYRGEPWKDVTHVGVYGGPDARPGNSDEAWDPQYRQARLIPHPDKGITLHERNSSTMLSPESPVVFRPVGGRTAEDDFFAMRAQMGGESTEPARDVVDHPDRYVGQFEVLNPDNGRWGLIEGIDELPDTHLNGDEIGDEEYNPVHFHTSVGVFQVQAGMFSDGNDLGELRVRPKASG